METNNQKMAVMPISKISYSALTQLLRNPLIFKMKHILNVYEGKMGVSGMIGRAVHEALKAYYGGNSEVAISKDKNLARSEAKEIGLKYLDTFSDAYIEYGKTGSRESMLKGYMQAMDFYFAEEPAYNEILMCEEKMTAELKTVNGEALPLPATGIPDLVDKTKNGDIEIVDLKIVTSFTDYETEDYIKIVQSQFLYHLLLAAKGIKAKRMLFRELKRTKNADGTPQIRDWAVPFDHEPYRIIFYNLYKDVVKFLSNPDAVYLPNLSDPFDGEHAGLIYAQGLISSDMSDVEVMHKVRDVAYVSKKFVTSSLDSAENKNLLPEEKIKLRLSEFGIPVVPVETKVGASVTQYRFKVSAGVRMSTIKKHKDDIARALEAKGEVRIIAPIAGTSLVGVEVENTVRESIKLSSAHLSIGTLSIPIGADVHGEVIKVALNDMPHLLVAGSSGSGKSVFLNTVIKSLTAQMDADQMKLLLIDPKRVELSAFNRRPHLMTKVIYEYDDAVRALMGLTDEMEERYKTLEKAEKKDIAEYNATRRNPSNRLPYIVVVIDEFADFIMRSKMEEKRLKAPAYSSRSKAWLYKKAKKLGSGGLSDISAFTKSELIEILEAHDAEDEMKREDADVELLVVRLAQMARAVGIHLILATQRPSVDVITGLIKANFPTRVAFTTSSPADSAVILGVNGAEKLSGKGDMLFLNPASRGLQRLQGLFS